MTKKRGDKGLIQAREIPATRKQPMGLVKASEVLPSLNLPEPQAESITPQSKYHFTRLKQIDALASIAEDPRTDMGFMARLLTLCSLPHTDPGTRPAI